MRRRLLVTYVSLFTLVLTALAAPLGAAIAARDTQRVFIDRQGDTARFASLAEPALRSGELVALRAELVTYDELYGIGAVVVDAEGVRVVGSRPDIDLTTPVAQRLVTDALGGEGTPLGGPVWPWMRYDLVVAEPVGRGGEVIGAAVTISPTGRLRARIAGAWVVLGVAGLLALLASVAVAVPVSRWILRPVDDLGAAAHALSAGDLDARAAVDTGPPELRRLARSFNEMADTVTGALAKQRAFVAHASHQLRNPLAALRLRVENLADHMDGSEEQRFALEETGRLAEILDALLALARAEAGQQDTEMLDAAAVVRERLAAWEPAAEARGVGLRCAGNSEPAAVVVACGTLGQALDALIDNAVKFTDAGDVVEVWVDWPDVAGHAFVDIHVADSGPGLSAAERELATERFWRAAAHQNTDGSGLGLSIVAVLLEASGGTVDLFPREPQGLDVRLRLPAAPQGAAPSARPWPPGSTGSLPDAAGRETS